ncbi:UNVERIFIED_CONTAM: hypothetical protein FKN15_038885 [Acipenser sinensis]
MHQPPKGQERYSAKLCSLNTTRLLPVISESQPPVQSLQTTQLITVKKSGFSTDLPHRKMADFWSNFRPYGDL